MTTLKYKLLIFIIVFPTFCLNATPDRANSDDIWDKIYFGGNMGLNIGSIIQIEFSPLVGYRFTEELSSGVGIVYQYYRDRRPGLTAYQSSIYGGKIFSRYIVYENVFAHVEYEAISLKTEMFDVLNLHPDKDRFWYSSLFIGGGYRQPIGERSFVYFMALWNLNHSANSPYTTNPVIRVGFTF